MFSHGIINEMSLLPIEFHFWYNRKTKKPKILPSFSGGATIVEDEWPHKETGTWYQITFWRFVFDIIIEK